MTSLPLSDARSGRNLVLAGTAATAAAESVKNGQRWREEQRLGDKARVRFLELASQDRRRIYYDADDSEEEAIARTLAFFESARICVDQAGFEEVLIQKSSRPILCYSETQACFSGVATNSPQLIFFGDAEVALTLQPGAEVSLCDQVSGRLNSVTTAEEGLNLFQPRVVLSEQARAEVDGWAHVNGWDESVTISTSADVYVHLSGQARLILGQAASVWAGPGTTIALSSGAGCKSIEIDDYSDSKKNPVKVLGPDGKLLFQGTDLTDDEIQREIAPGVVVSWAIPF